MLETRLIEDGEMENIDKLYTANKIIREIAFNLLFIENKIIKGKIIANSSQTIRVFSKMTAGILIKIIKKRRIRIFFESWLLCRLRVRMIGKIKLLETAKNI